MKQPLLQTPIHSSLIAWGLICLVVLILNLIFYRDWLQPIQNQPKQAKDQVQDLRVSNRPIQVYPHFIDHRSDDFFSHLPQKQQYTKRLSSLFRLASNTQLNVIQSDFHDERLNKQYGALHINLTLQGTYPQIRVFISSLLRAHPDISLDEVNFSRKSAGDAQITSLLDISLFYRADS